MGTSRKRLVSRTSWLGWLQPRDPLSQRGAASTVSQGTRQRASSPWQMQGRLREVSDESYEAVLAVFLDSAKDTNGSQFFITLAACRSPRHLKDSRGAEEWRSDESS